MGLYQLIMPVYSVISSITTVGLTVAASTLSAKYQARGDRLGICRVRRSCLTCLVVLLLPVAAVTVAFSDPISVYILGDARTRTGLILLLPCILLTGIENVQKHCFFGMGLVRPPAFSEMAEQIIRAVAVLGLLVLCLPLGGEGDGGGHRGGDGGVRGVFRRHPDHSVPAARRLLRLLLSPASKPIPGDRPHRPACGEHGPAGQPHGLGQRHSDPSTPGQGGEDVPGRP